MGVARMTLTDEQKAHLTRWINEGLKLSEIQKKLASEFGLTLTYMDMRFLVDDLRLTPKDPTPPPAPPKAAEPPPAAAAPTPLVSPNATPLAPTSPLAPGGALSVVVDRVARPGAMVSGSVTFSDGQKGHWYLDQMGRLGVVPDQKGYKPSAADVDAFQRQLEGELSKLGF